MDGWTRPAVGVARCVYVEVWLRHVTVMVPKMAMLMLNGDDGVGGADGNGGGTNFKMVTIVVDGDDDGNSNGKWHSLHTPPPAKSVPAP